MTDWLWPLIERIYYGNKQDSSAKEKTEENKNLLEEIINHQKSSTEPKSETKNQETSKRKNSGLFDQALGDIRQNKKVTIFL